MSAIIIGLCGAHRTGKSTLAEQLAINSKIGIIDISISQMQAAMGFVSSNQDYDWETRKEIQYGLLKAFKEELDYTFKVNSTLRSVVTYVTERTPLDLIGYLLVNAPAEPNANDHIWIKGYINECIQLTNKYYSEVYLVQPGISYVPDPKSASEDTIEALNAVYLSVSLNKDLNINMHVMPRELTDLNERIQFVLRGSIYV